jgi:hypothetical protein
MLSEDVTSVIVIMAVNTSNWSIYGKVGLLTDGEDNKTMLIFSSIYQNQNGIKSESPTHRYVRNIGKRL